MLTLRAGDRNSAEAVQLVRCHVLKYVCAFVHKKRALQDSLHSLLDELSEAPVTMSSEQPAMLTMKVPGVRPIASLFPDYCKSLDDEVPPVCVKRETGV